MMNATEFTNDQIPGLIGLAFAGEGFTVFNSEVDAKAVIAKDTCGMDYRIVTRADGKFLIALCDVDAGDFFYVMSGSIS